MIIDNPDLELVAKLRVQLDETGIELSKSREAIASITAQRDELQATLDDQVEELDRDTPEAERSSSRFWRAAWGSCARKRRETAADAARGIADAQTLLAAADRGLQRIAEALDLPLDAGVNRICAEIARLRCR